MGSLARRIALVVGCAAGVWSDVEAALKLAHFDAIYCVKQSGIHWPERFDVWATLHPEFMDQYEAERAKLGHPLGYDIVAPPPGELGAHGQKGRIARRVTYRWPGMTSSASSGIYGAKIALDDGFDVVLAGVPMEAKAGHFLPHTTNVDRQIRGKLWQKVASFERGFEIAKQFMHGRVKSMSGHTKEIFGSPDPDWLGGTLST